MTYSCQIRIGSACKTHMTPGTKKLMRNAILVNSLRQVCLELFPRGNVKKLSLMLYNNYYIYYYTLYTYG